MRAYKRLSAVERAFRSLKTVDLKVRPVFHRTEDRVRAHVFVCMLADDVEWHMRRTLKPVLFDDEDTAGAEARRRSIVAPATPSQSARNKAASKTTPAGDPVHSFQTLLDDLAAITRNTVMPRLPGARPFTIITRPTPLQHKILDLLGVNLSRSQSRHIRFCRMSRHSIPYASVPLELRANWRCSEDHSFGRLQRGGRAVFPGPTGPVSLGNSMEPAVNSFAATCPGNTVWSPNRCRSMPKSGG